MTQKRLFSGICFLAIVLGFLLPGCPADGGRDDPVAADFTVTGLEQTYDGGAKTVSIDPNSGKSAGTITIYYAGTNGTDYPKNTAAPSAVGDYAVTFDVAAAKGYNAAYGLIAGTLIIESQDVWAKVTGLDEIKGTWEASSFITIPEIPLARFLEIIGDNIPGIEQYKPYLPETLPSAPLDYSEVITIGGTNFDIDLIIDCKRYLEGTMGPLAFVIWGYLIAAPAQDTLKEKIEELVASYGITSFEVLNITGDFKIITKGGGPLPADSAIPDIFGLSVSKNQDASKLKIEIEIPEGAGQEIILTRKE